MRAIRNTAIGLVVAGIATYALNRHAQPSPQLDVSAATASVASVSFRGGPLGKALPGRWLVMTGDALVGDSLKAVINWSAPTDSAELGKADSTLYEITINKAALWWGGKAIAANTLTPRRIVGAGNGDSLRLKRPAVGDSVTFTIIKFRQCRKNECALPGSSAWTYKRSNAPPPTSPTIRTTAY